MTLPDFDWGSLETDVRGGQFEPATRAAGNGPDAKVIKFPCQACNGTGSWRAGINKTGNGKCFACNGKGHFLTSERERAQARQTRQASQARKVNDAREAFAEANPDVLKFLAEIRTWRQPSEFLMEMGEKLGQYGYLTEGQLAAVKRTMAKIAERLAERVANAADSRKPVDITGIERAFAAAAASGKKRLALHLGDFVFSPAKATGRNPGAIYVKSRDDEYLGKVMGGAFQPARECNAATATKIVEEASSITDFESIKVRGVNTGVCCCCGAELTDPVSIAAGIGPICATKWGF